MNTPRKRNRRKMIDGRLLLQLLEDEIGTQNKKAESAIERKEYTAAGSWQNVCTGIFIAANKVKWLLGIRGTP